MKNLTTKDTKDTKVIHADGEAMSFYDLDLKRERRKFGE